MDKWISVCLELCTHGMLSGSWYLWNHADTCFALHAVALPELCEPLPHVQGSDAFGSLWPHVLYLELSLLVLWWLIILPVWKPAIDRFTAQIVRHMYNRRATVTKKMCVHKGEKKPKPNLLTPYLGMVSAILSFFLIKWSNETYNLQ